MRRASLLVGFLTVLGCSSLSSITAYNDSELLIDLKVSDEEGETWRGRIDPHDQAEVWKRFGGPETLKFELGDKTIAFTAATMPLSLALAGSGGIQARWYWDGRQTRFEADELSTWTGSTGMP